MYIGEEKKADRKRNEKRNEAKNGEKVKIDDKRLYDETLEEGQRKS